MQQACTLSISTLPVPYDMLASHATVDTNVSALELRRVCERDYLFAELQYRSTACFPFKAEQGLPTDMLNWAKYLPLYQGLLTFAHSGKNTR